MHRPMIVGTETERKLFIDCYCSYDYKIVVECQVMFISGGSEMEEVKTKISQVEDKISAVEDEIHNVEDEIRNVEEEMRNCKRYKYDCAIKLCSPSCYSTFMFFSLCMCNSENDKQYLRDKAKQLRHEKEQLRDKEEQLRHKEERLRDEKKVLLERKWHEG